MKKLFIIVLIFAISFFVASNAVADLTTGLVAYYPFNGNANDESGSGHNGTVYGATLTTDRFDNADNAYSFDGNDYIFASSVGQYQHITWSVWFRTTHVYSSSSGLLLTVRGAGGIAMNPSNDVRGYLEPGYADWKGIDSIIEVNDGNWHHAVQTYDKQNIIFYVDGIQIDSLPDSDDINYDGNGMWFGKAWWQLSNFYNGVLDDIRIYNRALSASEIQQLYNGNSSYINITYPNGGEILSNGQDYTITWNSGNVTGNVQIDLYKGDTNILQLAASAPNTGSYAFNPPDSLTDGSDYRIGISAESGTVSDFSDTYFTITTDSATGGVIQLPRTGQTKCYDSAGTEISCTGTGQDGEIQAGVAWPDPRFTDNGDGTVTDNLTGLMWLKDGNCFDFGKRTWQNALDTADDFNSNPTNYNCQDYDENNPLYNDWRLPNINELLSFFNAEESDIAAWLNTQGFVNGQSRWYWSSSTYVINSSFAFVVDMTLGSSGYGYKLELYSYMWLVRDGDSGAISLPKTGQTESFGLWDDGYYEKGVTWPVPRYIDHENGTVTDNLTGLMWLKDGNCFGQKTWEDALDTVSDFNANPVNYICQDYTANYTDWRLPNRNESFSLIDRSQYSPALPIGHPFFNVSVTNPNIYWSSTTYEAYIFDSAWTIKMYYGSTGGIDKSNNCYVWPVRSGQLGSFGNLDISGNVTLNNSGLDNVNIALDGAASKSTSTLSDGYYSFFGLGNSSYTITPSLAGYEFNPPSLYVSLSGVDSTGQDFRACDTSVPFSGTLDDATTNSPLSEVTITVDGTSSDVTDVNGYYEIYGLSCGTHTVTVGVPSGYSSYSRTMDTSLNSTWDINLTKPETVYGGETNSGYSPDPVNTATGNYIYQKKDFEISGKGLSFIFERDYNSQDATDGPLGFGWGHTYNVSLTVNTDSTITIRWGDGKTETWTPDGIGGFTPQYGVFDTLTDNGDGTYTMKKKDLTEYNFDTSGSLSSLLDKNGNTITLTYSGGNLTQATDTAARNIDLTYDENNRITHVTDPIGRTLQFSYDTNGDLVTATDMNGNVTTYTYDADHQLLTVVDPRGNTVVTNVYDALKRVVTSQSDAKGGVTTYTYDEVNKKTTLVDQLGYTTIHYHDELLRLVQETDDSGNSAYYEYDSTGNRIKVTDKNGNETNYTYDSNGNVLTKTDALGNVTTITYDLNNNPLTRTDALGNVTSFGYDANGNLTSTTDPLGNSTAITYNANGQPLTITDARGAVTTNTYDTDGNLLTVTDDPGNITTYTYNGVGRRLTAQDALGHTTTYTYDNNNNLLTVTDPLGNVTTYTYDGNNNKLTVTDPNGNTTTYAYDVKDLLDTITDPLLNTVTNTYDGLDRKDSVTDKRGNTTTYTYDAIGNVLSVTDPLSKVTSFTYDANGNKLTATNPLTQTTTYTYDELNRLVTVVDNLGNITTTAYDALGRVISTTNAKGQTTGFDYDALGRLIQVTDANGGTVSYTYDENGNRLTMTEPNGNTTTYTYDTNNRLIQKVEPLGNTYQYAYDAIGNRISLTDAKGITINYTYDANNRLSVITYPDTSIVTFSYDANGNRTQMGDSLGTSTYSYDALNRMFSYTDPFGKTIGYGYDANGNRTSLTYPDSKVVNYAYDALNRLSNVTDWLTNTTAYAYDTAGKLITTTNPNGTTANYFYDTAGRLTGLSNEYSDTSVISSYAYTLDALGNHTSAVKDEPLLPILTNKNITYTYDAENRLINEGGNTHFYDANGNLTAKGSDSFIYDYEDRLIQSNISGVITQYGYDGLGNRLSKTEGSTTTKYVLDINRSLPDVIAETDNAGTITAYYVYGLGLISKVLPDGTAYYYHYDSRGSTIALSDAVENLTDTYAYDTFGNLANSQGTTGNPFKFVGRYGVMDEGNGLNYIRARYYSPDIGRFITKDPQTGNDRDGQSLNRYIYALNNPVRLVDISGFSPQEGSSIKDFSVSTDESHTDLMEENFTELTVTVNENGEIVHLQPKENEYDLVVPVDVYSSSPTDTTFYRVTSFLDTEFIEESLRFSGGRLMASGMATGNLKVWAAGVGITIGFIITDTVTNEAGQWSNLRLGNIKNRFLGTP